MKQSKKRGRPTIKYKLSMNWARNYAEKYRYLGSGADDPYINDIIKKYDNYEIHYDVAEMMVREYLNKLFEDDYLKVMGKPFDWEKYRNDVYKNTQISKNGRINL